MKGYESGACTRMNSRQDEKDEIEKGRERKAVDKILSKRLKWRTEEKIIAKEKKNKKFRVNGNSHVRFLIRKLFIN